MKILLVEDEAMLRHSIEEYLVGFGHAVTSCHEGRMALGKIKEEKYDLYLLDINIPLHSGFDLISAIRATNPLTPVIFITAMTEIDDITRGYELGCTDYLKKPFKLPELKLRIDQIFKLLSPPKVKHVPLSERYVFDQTSSTLYDHGTEHILTKRHRMIMSLLVSSLDRAVDLEVFRLKVWERDDIDDATIRAEINRLKKSLHEELIINLKGIGYKIPKFYV
jgi:DNA-binding response OmpR family regulator